MINLEKFCKERKLNTVNTSIGSNSILHCIHNLSPDYSLEFLQSVILCYIKENFYHSRLRKYLHRKETLASIKINIKDCTICDHISLQALSTVLEVEINLLSNSSNGIHLTTYPIKEPEIEYKKNKVFHILKSSLNTCCFYYSIE